MVDRLQEMKILEAEKHYELVQLRLLEYRQEMRPSSHLEVEIWWSQVIVAYVAFRGNVAAQGDTPEQAMDNFDHLWITGQGRIDIPDDLEHLLQE